MKNLLLLIATVAFLNIAFGQTYEIAISNGVTAQNNPLELGVPGALDILSNADNADLSAWQSLPFPFEFYGSPVSGYTASRNGFISFEDAAGNTDAVSNTALPDAAGPNSAIYAFWDELEFDSDVARISTWTSGTAPNRVHFIRWFNVSVPGSGFSGYFAIRLYECGSFDVVHAGGFSPSGLSGTVGCENADGSSGAMVVGSPQLSFPSLGAFDIADDVVYTFISADYDLAISKIDIPKRVHIGDHEVRGRFTNYGKVAITSLRLNYTVNDGPLVSMMMTDVNIPPVGGTFSFVHDSIWTIPDAGELYEICVYGDQFNGGNADQISCNDQRCQTIFASTGNSANRKLLIEEFSGTWCGHCPDGEVELEAILADYPEEVVAVAYHGGDDMSTNAGYEVSDMLNISAAPQAGINRTYFPAIGNIAQGRDLWASSVASELGRYTPASIDVSHVYNPDNHILRVTLTADFVDQAYGDMRFSLIITEDGVTGTGPGYDQVNFYDNTFGHPFAGAGNPIIGYEHHRVMRAMPGGAMGTAGVIPTLVSPGEQYSEEFLFVIPSGWEEEKLSLVGLLAYHSNSLRDREIINVEKVSLLENPTSSADIPDLLQEAKLFPNPAREQLNLSFHLPQSIRASVRVYDATGRLVLDLGVDQFQAGQHQLNYDIATLRAGMYNLLVQTADALVFTSKFVVLP